MKRIFSTCCVLITFFGFAMAQTRADQAPVTYEELYDEPYAVNKLFVQFQPIYGELFVTNVNAGFGLEATYFWNDKAQFRAHARKTYNAKFDFAREHALRTSDVANQPRVFNYYELGGTYHIKDFEESSKTKMVLYRKSYKGDRWASRVPISAEIPSKVRKIYGARLGGFFYDSHTDVNRVLKAQGNTLSVLVDQSGEAIPPSLPTDDNSFNETSVFTGIAVGGIYAGGSMSWIRNIAVDFDNYEAGVDDLILTAYFDILVAPSMNVDDILFQELDSEGNLITRRFSGDVLDTNMLGFRLGLDGKFNRTLSWAYGGELGYRPSFKGSGFYAIIKISFPVFSTNLDYGVEAFGK